MAWLDEGEFREIYVTESATEIVSAQIEQCLRLAARQITRLVGVALVGEVLTAPPPYVLDKFNDLRDAQGKLAYRELLLIQSSRARAGGIIETERDANADTTNKYVSFAETERRRDALYREALDILEIYFSLEEVAEILERAPRSTSVPIEIGW